MQVKAKIFFQTEVISRYHIAVGTLQQNGDAEYMLGSLFDQVVVCFFTICCPMSALVLQ